MATERRKAKRATHTATKVTAKKAAAKKPARKPAEVAKKAAGGTTKRPDAAKTERLFLAVYRRNWDEGVGFFQRALTKPECDRGTALLIYWMARPAYYARYASAAEVPRHERDAYALIRSIEARIDTLPEVIAYAPPEDEVAAARGKVPERMTRPSGGPRDAKSLLDGDLDAQRMLDACRLGDLDVVKALVNRFHPDTPIGGAYTIAPLVHACICGRADVVRVLLDAGGNLRLKSGGNTLLHFAGGRDVVELLLARGLPVDQKGAFGRTALHAGCYMFEDGWAERMGGVMEALLRAGADPKLRDGEGLDARALATRAGNRAAVALLDRLPLR